MYNYYKRMNRIVIIRLVIVYLENPNNLHALKSDKEFDMVGNKN